MILFNSDGEYAGYSSRPGSIAEDEKGQSVLHSPLPPPPVSVNDADADDLSTPRRTGGVADGATEEDKRKDQLLRRSFSSPSVAEEADLQLTSTGAYPMREVNDASNSSARVQPALSNPLKVRISDIYNVVVNSSQKYIKIIISSCPF